MIFKTRDARPEVIESLERRSSVTPDPMRRSALRGAASRLRADTTSADACALLDAAFGDCEDWTVLHDLRLIVGAHAVHLNHLLVSASLECVCVDSRYLRHGLEMDASGRCTASSPYGSGIIASPLTKAARDVRMLAATLGGGDLLPRRFGLGPRASVRAVVLTNPAMRIGVAPGVAPASVDVLPSDALFPTLWKRRGRAFERLASEARERLCEGVVALHRPAVPAALTEAA